MKKIILSLMGAMLGCTALAVNCVSAQQRSTNYAARTVTFKLTWTNCNAVNQHFNKVWCFIDCREIDAGGGKGAWKRAVFSGTPAVVNGTYAAGNTAGFYVTGTNGQSATVTATIGNVAADTRFEWCAFATDYPPNVSARAGTVHTLKGAPSFVVNKDAVAGNQFTGTVVSLTDATGCPGCMGRDVAANANIPCCPELTAIGGYCRNLPADGAQACATCQVEFKGSTGIISDANMGCPAGWRPATSTDIACLYPTCYPYLGMAVADGNGTAVKNCNIHHVGQSHGGTYPSFAQIGGWGSLNLNPYAHIIWQCGGYTCMWQCYHANNYPVKAFCIR